MPEVKVTVWTEDMVVVQGFLRIVEENTSDSAGMTRVETPVSAGSMLVETQVE